MFQFMTLFSVEKIFWKENIQLSSRHFFLLVILHMTRRIVGDLYNIYVCHRGWEARSCIIEPLPTRFLHTFRYLLAHSSFLILNARKQGFFPTTFRVLRQVGSFFQKVSVFRRKKNIAIFEYCSKIEKKIDFSKENPEMLKIYISVWKFDWRCKNINVFSFLENRCFHWPSFFQNHEIQTLLCMLLPA